jgi:histidyl-tRNA synthetase
MERLVSVVPFKAEKEKFLYLAYLGEEAKKAGMELTRFLRSKGVECLIEYKDRGLKSNLSRANKLKARWVVMIGEDELKSGMYKLKDMETGDQQDMTRDDILKLIIK